MEPENQQDQLDPLTTHETPAAKPRRTNYTRARNLALELEARGDWQAALSALKDVPKAEAIRARLLRKINHEPAVLIESETTLVMHDTLLRESLSKPVYHAYIATVVETVATPQNIPGNIWADHLLESCYSFIRTIAHLHNQPDDPIFALRIIGHGRGRTHPMLTIAWLMRASGDTHEEAHEAALELWATLAHLLPGSGRQYFFRPLFDEEEVESLLRPFATRHIHNIAHITRRESVTDETAIYHPFRPGNLDLHRLCRALLDHAHPAMLSVQLLPTSLMAWEQQALWSTGGDDAIPEGILLNNDDDFTSLWQQSAEQEQKAESASWLLRSLQESAFAMQISVATTGKATRLLPEQIAAELFAPSLGTPFGGGSKITHITESDMAIARRNLDMLDLQICDSAHPARDRLRWLYGEQEAAFALRLPVPGVQGVPGLPLLEIKPTPPPRHTPNGTVLGQSVVRTMSGFQRVAQALNDRRRHTYIVGKTGTGKSTLMRVSAMQDIDAGHGVCVIDPHGDLVEDILRVAQDAL
jgi:hypothetical protein